MAFYAGGGVRAFPNGLVPTKPVDFGEIDGETSTDEISTDEVPSFPPPPTFPRSLATLTDSG